MYEFSLLNVMEVVYSYHWGEIKINCKDILKQTNFTDFRDIKLTNLDK